MKNQNTLDDAIKLLYLSDSELSNNHADLIFKKEYKTKMSDKQKQLMLMQLKQKHVTAYTFGNVLTQAMEAKKWNVQSLIEKAHVPLNVMENLLADKIYANTVPVGFMKNILSILEIPFSEAANAIRTSFDSLKVQPAYNAVARPVARKSSHRKTNNTQAGNSKTKALFENEEALNKYLNHLEQIMEE